jgi:SAM-dependent methyltransferase
MSTAPKAKLDLARFFGKLKRSVIKRVSRVTLRRKYGELWTEEGALLKRHYGSYEDYVRHQQSKLETIDLKKYDTEFRQALRERLRRLDVPWSGQAVLCLAARLGTEVKAFLDLGAFAVGIDLNPGRKNRYVVHGDFHDLQYAPASIDVVFTNSLDHAYDVNRIACEIRRVLKPGGMFIVEAVKGKAEGAAPGFFESFFWSTTDQLIDLLREAGLDLLQRAPFQYPWPGEQICFKKAASLADASLSQRVGRAGL